MLQAAFSRVVRQGSLEVLTPSGGRLTFGDGTAPHVTLRLADERAIWVLLLDPELRLGELYMDGRLELERGSIYEFLELLLRDAGGARSFFRFHPLMAVRELRWRLAPANTARRAQRNVAHHYDLDGRLYDLFLDADRQYSCAYFDRPDQSLDEAQKAKKRHIASKLRVRPGHRVLDIGSGWGGLAQYLVETARAGEALGVTLSHEQLAYSRERVEKAGLSERVRFALQDYRKVEGTFDRIVSVGMFEHVGRASYGAFFQTCARLLADDGVMLLHTIGRTGEPCGPNPWITRYIFPGGHIPTLSEIAPVLERSGLALTDLEVLRLHYAMTLRAWRERFLSRRDEAARLYDERFCRMWEFYLAAFEAAFRWEDLAVFQLQLTKRNDILPLQRSYMIQEEAALKEWEARSHRPVGEAPAQPSRIGAQREASAAAPPRQYDP